MLKFDVEHGKVFIDGIHSSLKLFSELKKKFSEETFIKLCTYIHLASQVEAGAPFATAAYNEVSGLVKIQVFGKDYPKGVVKKDLDKWVKEYKNAYETPEIRIVNIFNRKVDQIRELIDNTKPSIKAFTTNSGSAGYSSNLGILTKAMTELDGLLTVKDKLEAKIRKQETAGSTRAGKVPSLLEKEEL